MKWVFAVTLLIVAGAGGLWGTVVVNRWNTSMVADHKIVPGQMPLRTPAGTLPREDGELVLTVEQARARKNPVNSATPESIANGRRLYSIACAPCHGPDGKGDGPVATKFVPPPDLRKGVIVQKESDGFLQRYIGQGGALMPGHSEALSPREQWDVVNYIRSLQKE